MFIIFTCICMCIVDKEELRMDRAVKVSRKELNALMAELFEYADMISSDDEDNPQEISSTQLINTLSASVFSDIMVSYSS